MKHKYRNVLNKSLRCFESLHRNRILVMYYPWNYYWRNPRESPRLVPTLVYAFMWGLPLPPAWEDPCQWCDNHFCSPLCLRHQSIEERQAWELGRLALSQNQSQMWSRKTETLYTNPRFTHEASRAISADGHTGVDPGHAWFGTNNNTGSGKV